LIHISYRTLHQYIDLSRRWHKKINIYFLWLYKYLVVPFIFIKFMYSIIIMIPRQKWLLCRRLSDMLHASFSRTSLFLFSDNLLTFSHCCLSFLPFFLTKFKSSSFFFLFFYHKMWMNLGTRVHVCVWEWMSNLFIHLNTIPKKCSKIDIFP
jgi:hypothetical protein